MHEPSPFYPVSSHDAELLLAATVEAAQRLLKAKDLAAALPEALKVLGQAAKMDRLVVFLETNNSSGTPIHQVEAEWTAPGVFSRDELGLTELCNDDFPDLTAKLHAGEMYWLHLDDVVGAGQLAFRKLDIVTTTGYPIFVEGRYVGLMAFDDCRKWRPFDRRESETLATVAALIGSVFHRHNLVDAIAREKQSVAEQRAAEATRANLVLRRSVTRLAEVGGVKEALVEAVCAAAEVLDADGGALGVYHPHERGFRTLFSVVGNRISELGEIDFDNRLYSIDEGPIQLAWEKFQTGEDILWCPLNGPYLTADSRDYLSALGMKTTVLIAIRRGTECIGYLGFASHQPGDLSIGQCEILKGVADQVSLMLEMSRLSNEAKNAAVAIEREAGAQRRSAELARGSHALQATVDALSELSTVDHVIPRMLEIVAQTFGTRTCSFFKNDPEGKVRLLYWYMEGETFRPDELVQLDSKRFGLVRQLAEGFVVPDSYLGGPAAEVIGPVVLDHVAGTSVPEFDRFAIESGWELELNVGVGANGVRASTLCIYRERSRPYTENEVALSEALAKQLALALQTSRLSDLAKDAAIAREQERSSRERIDELSRSNQALERSVTCVSSSRDFTEALSQIFVEIVSTAEAAIGYFFNYDPLSHTLGTEFWIRDGILHRGFDPDAAPILRQRFDANVTPAFQIITQAKDIMVANHDEIDENIRAAAWPGVLDWHAANGIKASCAIPLLAGGRPLGIIGLGWRENQTFSKEKKQFLFALTSQASLVKELRKLANAETNFALTRERESAEEQRAARLAEANDALRKTVDILADEKHMDQALRHVLKVTSEQLDAPSSALWLFDDDLREFRIRLVYLHGEVIEATPANAPRLQNEWPLDRDLYWKAHLEARRPHVYDVENYSKILPAQRAFLGRLGIKTLLGVPLILGSRTFGSFTVRFGEKRMFKDEEIELVQALAHQATLACQLTRLAEESQQAAVLEERGRIAGEIHDSLAQAFTGISLQLEAAMLSKDKVNSQFWTHVEVAKQLACFGLAEARASVLTLRPNALDHGDLSGTLKQLAQRTEIAGQLKCTFSEHGYSCELPADLKYEAFRIAQEALGNALKHAQPQAIGISLSYRPGQIELTVEDDGAGFDPKRSNGTRGFGLIGMENRCKKRNGSFEIQSDAGKGTRVTAVLPTNERP